MGAPACGRIVKRRDVEIIAISRAGLVNNPPDFGGYIWHFGIWDGPGAKTEKQTSKAKILR